MKEATRNLLVGIFVLGSFVVLGVLMVWFGEAPSWLGGSEWTLRITGVRELAGVSEGSPVKLNGVEIGRVQSLEFEDPSRPAQGVVIVAGIKNLYSVPEGAVARVYGSTFGIGTGHIDIVVEPGTRGKPLEKEFAAIRGEMHSIIGELISKELVSSIERTITRFGDVAEEATPVARNLAELLEQRSVEEVDRPGAAAAGVTANIATIIQRLDHLVANVNAVLGDENVQGDVRATVSDLRAATNELRRTIELWKSETQRLSENLNRGIDRTEENLEQSFTRLNRVLDNLDDATGSMAALLQRVEQGDGTAGMLARDARLYEAALLTLQRFGELVATLQRITGKIEEDGYINIGKVTPIGTFTKKYPVGERSSESQ